MSDLGTGMVFPDGTVVMEIDETTSPYNVFVKNAQQGWDNRVWSQAGSDIMCEGPTGKFRIIYWPGIFRSI